jgi:RNA polymerase sigma factor (sigma-70 family)
LIHFLLQRQTSGGVAYDDLVQEGRIALWRAVLGFDPQRGVAFSTYAGTAIERRIWQVVARARRHRTGSGPYLTGTDTGTAAVWQSPKHSGEGLRRCTPQPRGWLPLDQADQLEAVADAWHQAQVHTALLEAVAHLPDRLQAIILAHYGLDGQAPGTWQALGQRFGVTKARIGQLHQDALVLLRLPVFSARLRRLCGQDSRAAYARSVALSRTWQQRKRGRKRR